MGVQNLVDDDVTGELEELWRLSETVGLDAAWPLLRRAVKRLSEAAGPDIAWPLLRRSVIEFDNYRRRIEREAPRHAQP